MGIIEVIFTWVVEVATTSAALYTFARMIAAVLWHKDCA